MTFKNFAAIEAAHEVTSLAADLADAAYKVVLRHGIDGSWLDLQLDVWRVAESVTPGERKASRVPSAAEFLAWREMFLSELTDAIYRTALHYGLHGPFLELELDLHMALREVIERPRSSAALRLIFRSSARPLSDAVLARLGSPVTP
jgi:hypothetical protein